MQRFRQGRADLRLAGVCLQSAIFGPLVSFTVCCVPSEDVSGGSLLTLQRCSLSNVHSPAADCWDSLCV